MMWTRREYKELFDQLRVVYGTYPSGTINREVLGYRGRSLEMYLNARRDGFLYFAANTDFEGTFDLSLWDAVPPARMQQKDQDDPKIKGFVPKQFLERQAFVDMLSKR